MYDNYREPEDPSLWPLYVIIFVVQAIGYAVLAHFMTQVIERISRDLRTITPAQPWLSVIPFFGSFWIFYMVQQSGTMLHEEFARRKILEFETTPGLIIGWGFSFTILVAQLTLLVDVPAFTILLYLAAVVQLIVYAVKLSGFRSKRDRDLLRSPTQPFAGSNFNLPFYSEPQHHQPVPPWMNNNPATSSPVQPPVAPADDLDRWKPK